MNLGGPELLILVAIAVLLFGAGWLPKAAKNLGKAKVEMDKAQQQFTEAKDSVVEATGVKELESTMRKANKALNATPHKLIKDAAKSAIVPTAAAATDETDSPTDEGIEDAEIVADSPDSDSNINLDFN